MKIYFYFIFVLLSMATIFTVNGCKKEKAADLPLAIIATLDINLITNTTAKSGGYITADGGTNVTARGICWNIAPNPTIANNHTTDAAGTGLFSSAITGLTAGSTYYVRAYATNSGGIAYGLQVSFTTTGLTDIDDNVYKTVTIGTQVWMKENLKTTRYRDGSAITEIQDSLTWANVYNTGSTTPAWCYYGGNTANNATYGKLYNWYAVADLRNVCPTGWHVPTDDDFTQLTDFLGGEFIAGGKMKAITLWNAPNTGADNSSGFTALPAGNRSTNANFTSIGSFGYCWSATERSATNARYLYLYSTSSDAVRFDYNKANGFSVRCVKD